MSYKVKDMLTALEAQEYQEYIDLYFATRNPDYVGTIRAYEREARKRYGGAIVAIDALNPSLLSQ